MSTHLSVVSDDPAPSEARRPLPMWSFLAANNVPREARTPACAAFGAWMDQYAGSLDERERQLRDALPHIEGAGHIAGACLVCRQPWPCASYILEVNGL